MRVLCFLMIMILVACSHKINREFKLIKFNETIEQGSKSVPLNLTMEVPKGGELRKGTFDFTGDYHVEYRIAYPDSSILYIGNSNETGSRLNIANRVAVGVNALYKDHALDSLNFDGEQSNGRVWKENILGDFIVGYVNVPSDRKNEFDKALLTVKRKQ
jgi:hypothetical protein